MGVLFSNILVFVFIYLMLSIGIFLGYLLVFTILYVLPGPNLSRQFSFKNLLRLDLIIVGTIFAFIQVFDILPIPHILPFIISGSKTVIHPEVQFLKETIQQSPFPHTYILNLPFHKFEYIMSSLLGVVITMIITSYAKFLLKLSKWHIYYLTLGTSLVASILYYSAFIGYGYFIGIITSALVAVTIHKFSVSKKAYIVVCIAILAVSFTLFTFISEKIYVNEGKARQEEVSSQNKKIEQDSSGKWETFINKAGGYTVAYPPKLLEQKNNWIGKDTEKMSDFHLVDEDIVEDIEKVKMTIRPNSLIEETKKLYEQDGMKVCGATCTPIHVTHKVINFKGGTADEYSYTSSYYATKIETLFKVGDNSFSVSTEYPVGNSSWYKVYTNLWSSIELIK